MNSFSYTYKSVTRNKEIIIMSNQRVKLFSASVCAILICGGMGGTAAYANESAGKSQVIKSGEVPQGLDKIAWNKIRNQIDSESIQSVTIENRKSSIENSSVYSQSSIENRQSSIENSFVCLQSSIENQKPKILPTIWLALRASV